MKNPLFKKEILRLKNQEVNKYISDYNLARASLYKVASAMGNFIEVLNEESGFVLFTPIDKISLFKGEFISEEMVDEQIAKTKHPTLLRIKERIARFQEEKIYYPYAVQIGRAIVSASISDIHPEVTHTSLFEDTEIREIETTECIAYPFNN